jgi:hypothetical protein
MFTPKAGVATSENLFGTDWDQIGWLKKKLDRIWIGLVGSNFFGSGWDRMTQKRFDRDRIRKPIRSIDPIVPTPAQMSKNTCPEPKN